MHFGILTLNYISDQCTLIFFYFQKNCLISCNQFYKKKERKKKKNSILLNTDKVIQINTQNNKSFSLFHLT